MNSHDDKIDFTKLTFSIIKPKSVVQNLIGKINSRIENAGFKIVAQRMIKMSLAEAEMFYMIHKERPFFSKLCEIMSSGPVVIQVLYHENNSVAKYRDLMGATNPADAADGTLRHEFGESLDHNAVHGSDSYENAEIEIRQFFKEDEIFVKYFV